jgi:hypothetical protein
MIVWQFCAETVEDCVNDVSGRRAGVERAVDPYAVLDEASKART